jgi:hypothetical protein
VRSPVSRAISFLVAAVLLAVILVRVLTGDAASFSATMLDATAVNRPDLVVKFRVLNTGRATGTSTCTVTVESYGSAYGESGTVRLTQAVPPGQSVVGTSTVAVSDNQAMAINPAAGVRVSC